MISYKGPTTSALLYGDVTLRTFGDMDFLVKRADLDALCDLLRERLQNLWTGTPDQKELMELEQKEYCFVSGPFSVEPHWSITARRFPFDIEYPPLWSRAQEIEFNGSKLLTFGPEDMLLVLCVCGCKGKWKRIQMVTDVAEALRKWPDLDWETCLSGARAVEPRVCSGRAAPRPHAARRTAARLSDRTRCRRPTCAGHRAESHEVLLGRTHVEHMDTRISVGVLPALVQLQGPRSRQARILAANDDNADDCPSRAVPSRDIDVVGVPRARAASRLRAEACMVSLAATRWTRIPREIVAISRLFSRACGRGSS